MLIGGGVGHLESTYLCKGIIQKVDFCVQGGGKGQNF